MNIDPFWLWKLWALSMYTIPGLCPLLVYPCRNHASKFVTLMEQLATTFRNAGEICYPLYDKTNSKCDVSEAKLKVFE